MTPTFFGFLVGPSSINRRADGSLGGLVVEEYGARAAFLCVSAAASLTLALYTLLPETISEATAAEEAARPSVAEGEPEAGNLSFESCWNPTENPINSLMDD